MSKYKSTDLWVRAGSGVWWLSLTESSFKPSDEDVWEKLHWFCPHVRNTLEKITALAWENNFEAWENWNIVQGRGRSVFCIFLFVYVSLSKLGVRNLSCCLWSCFNQESTQCLSLDGACVTCNWGVTTMKSSRGEGWQRWAWEHCSILWLYFSCQVVNYKSIFDC